MELDVKEHTGLFPQLPQFSSSSRTSSRTTNTLKLVALGSVGIVLPAVFGAVTPNSLGGRNKNGVLVQYPGVSESNS